MDASRRVKLIRLLRCPQWLLSLSVGLVPNTRLIRNICTACPPRLQQQAVFASQPSVCTIVKYAWLV